MSSKPQRIHIMGATASGKTTLAQQIAELLDIPSYDLDIVAYEGGFGRKRTLDERMVDLQIIIDQPAWVTEGAYLWWIDDLLRSADAIVWLDLPWYVSMPRIFTRHFKLSWAGTNRHPGILKLLRFFVAYIPFYTEKSPRKPKSLDDDTALNRVGLARYLQPYRAKVVYCRSVEDVNAFRKQLGRESDRARRWR